MRPEGWGGREDADRARAAAVAGGARRADGIRGAGAAGAAHHDQGELLVGTEKRDSWAAKSPMMTDMQQELRDGVSSGAAERKHSWDAPGENKRSLPLDIGERDGAVGQFVCT